MASRTSKPVWERTAPAKSKHTSLTPAKKSAAKARAKRAGRPYPNLVDNMRAARGRTRTKKTAAKKTSRGKHASKGRGRKSA